MEAQQQQQHAWFTVKIWVNQCVCVTDLRFSVGLFFVFVQTPPFFLMKPSLAPFLAVVSFRDLGSGPAFTAVSWTFSPSSSPCLLLVSGLMRSKEEQWLRLLFQISIFHLIYESDNEKNREWVFLPIYSVTQVKMLRDVKTFLHSVNLFPHRDS